MNKNYETAIIAAISGGEEIMKIYNDSDEIQVQHKEDNSPLTLADKAANDKIIQYLNKTNYPIISEENRQFEYSTRKNWDSVWIVDPLDGTKEFIKKNGEFTVNIALCQNGEPIFGVIYVPVTRELYYGTVSNNKAFKTTLNEEHQVIDGLFKESDCIVPAKINKNLIRVVGSRSHMNEETALFIDELKKEYEKIEIVSKGSSLKFCLVAEGKADVYPRFAPTMEWDTAAGHAICKAAGLKVTDQSTKKEVRYNKENLLNPYFLVKSQ